MRQFLDAAPDAMLVVGGDGLIGLVNTQAEQLFGYTRDELAGQPVELLIPESRRAGHAARREAYVHDPRTREMGTGLTIEGRRKDGSTFPADIKLSPYNDSVIAAIRDVTARRAEEERCYRLLSARSILPDQSIHMVATSPPYYGLRRYLKSDDPLSHQEIGAESTPEEYIENIVAVGREIRRERARREGRAEREHLQRGSKARSAIHSTLLAAHRCTCGCASRSANACRTCAPPSH